MRTVEEFASAFPSERVLQQALARLLARIPGHSGVQILQGPNEIGKDIIFYTQGPFGQMELNACVIKNKPISGDAQKSTGARTVFNQAQQALDTRLLDENGREQRVKRVFIMTPHPISQPTVRSILGALQTSHDLIQFMSGATLLGLFKAFWPDYLNEEYKLIQSYADMLEQTTTTAKELEGLAFQYQLGTVDTSIQRIYVRPRFHRTIRSYTVEPFFAQLPPITDRAYSRETLTSTLNALRIAQEFLSILVGWKLCRPNDAEKAATACSDLSVELENTWNRALAGRIAERHVSVSQAETLGVRLPNIAALNQLHRSAIAALRLSFAPLQQKIVFVTDAIHRGQIFGADNLTDEGFQAFSLLDGVARTAGSSCIAAVSELTTTFELDAIDKYTGPLFVVAPAGFGKTSFCRWNALNDLEKLVQGRSNALPVYVPLHQVGRLDNKTFRTAFLKHAGMSALLPKNQGVPFERIRVYLDGLDEVASDATRRRIAQLAKEASDADPSLQVVLTARDYVFGAELSWLPQISLSGFNDTDLMELAANWLEHSDVKIGSFFTQLSSTPVLREMMSVPLLATLIVLVFRQTGKLPESKTRLYEIFVDLHNGGWDLAKGVQRPSKYSAAEKMFLLKRIAGWTQGARRREILDEQCSGLAKACFKKADWGSLKEELARDGLVVPLGRFVAFAHHSFQEFLAAKQLVGDPNASDLNLFCEDYLGGSDWWGEVLRFYLDLVAKPYEAYEWLDERVKILTRRRPGHQSAIIERAKLLKNYIIKAFPYARFPRSEASREPPV